MVNKKAIKNLVEMKFGAGRRLEVFDVKKERRQDMEGKVRCDFAVLYNDAIGVWQSGASVSFRLPRQEETIILDSAQREAQHPEVF